MSSMFIEPPVSLAVDPIFDVKRMTPSLLRELPFYTDALSRKEDLDFLCSSNPNPTLLTSLVRHIQKFEAVFFDPGQCDKEVFNMQNRLGIRVIPDTSKSNATEPLPVRPSIVQQINVGKELAITPGLEAVKLTNFYCMYRLADAAAFVEGKFARAPQNSRKQLRLRKTPDMSLKLNTWPKILLDFRLYMQNTSRPASSTPITGELASVSIFRSLSTVYAAAKGNKILQNFLIAALHIASIKDTNLEPKVLPDIGEHLNQLQVGIRLGSNVNEAEKQCLEYLFPSQSMANTGSVSKDRSSSEKRKGPSSLRAPLQLSLMLSPIFLLQPILLTNGDWNRSHMIEIARALGSEKPDLILSIEKLIWQTLFRLAEGRFDPLDELQALYEHLPWLDIDQSLGNPELCGWFNLSYQSRSANNLPKQLALPVPLNSPTPSPFSAPAVRPATLSPSGSSSSPEYRSPETDSQRNGLDADDDSGDTPDREDDVRLHESKGSEDVMMRLEDLDNHREKSDAGMDVEIGHDGIVDDLQKPEEAMDVEEDGEGHEDKADKGLEAVVKTPTISLPPRKSTRVPPTIPQIASPPAKKPTKKPAPKPPIIPANSKPTKKPAPKPKDNAEEVEQTKPSGSKRLKPDSKELTPPQGGDSLENAIDVDLLFDPVGPSPYVPRPVIELDITKKRARHGIDRTLVAYGPKGERREYRPRFHLKNIHDKLNSFFEAVESGYVDGKPKHVNDQENSCMAILSEEALDIATPREILDILRTKHIVVTDCVAPNLEFNAENLRKIQPLHSVISIQDNSVDPSSELESRTVDGTVQQLLDSALDPDGRILNALEFPAWYGGVEPNSYSTDLRAWHETRGAKGHSADVEYPRGHMQWDLVATGDTVTFLHIDAEGPNTGVTIKVGEKVWFLGKPKLGRSLADIDIFLRKGFALDKVLKSGYFDWEAIVLSPGTRLLMRANTPHVVFGPERTISSGFHFYSTPTMQDTSFGLIHTFICTEMITNTTHYPTRLLLRRIAQFYYDGLVKGTVEPQYADFGHLPDMTNITGVVDFLSLCNLVILGNVLDHRTYSAPNQGIFDEITVEQQRRMTEFDVNNIDRQERDEIIFSRGMCLALLSWFEANFDIIKGDGLHIRGISTEYLARQAVGILNYKKLAVSKNEKGAPHCTPKLLEIQIRNALQVHPSALKTWENLDPTQISSLKYEFDPLEFEIKRANPPRDSSDLDEGNFMRYGETPLDTKFKMCLRERREHDTKFEEIREHLQEARVRKKVRLV